MRHEIDELKKDEEVDLILGGPPCQAYSYIDRAALQHKEDERKTLYKYYGQFLRKHNPRLFIFYRVTGTGSHGRVKTFARAFRLCILAFNAAHPEESEQVIIAAGFFAVHIRHSIRV